MPPASDDALLHDWVIEEREVERHLTRRGRKHAFERLHPARTALVVVDLVPFFVEVSAYCRGILPNVATLASAARTAGATVSWVVPGYAEPTGMTRELLGDQVADLYARSGGDGPPAQRVWPGLVAAGDLAVEKTAHSAFFPVRCELHDLLQARGVDTVLVAGTVTNVCVEGTVRDASTLGYRTVLVADACAAMRDQDHNAALHVVYRSFGDVRSTAEAVGLFTSSGGT